MSNRIFRSFAMFIAAFVLFVGMKQSSAQPVPLPACYTTRQELYALMFTLQDSFPNLVKVDSIGHSRGDMLGVEYPIYAVKFSDNVQTFEDEPVSLIICHIHGEELIGMEACVKYMRLLTHHYIQYREVMNNTQMYFIPTMNPDGLEIVTEPNTPDNTWRKNGYHPFQLGNRSCLIVPGVGEDSCGVDLNRNFGLNWIFGDTIWKREAVEPFDYFRGPGAFSEPEAQAIRDFAMQIKPTVSIVYHASRQGGNAERSIVAWQWGPDGLCKLAPDETAIDLWNNRYVSKTTRWGSTGSYLPVHGGTHNGVLQEWFYWKLGTFQANTETSPADTHIQPNCSDLDALTNTILPSLDWMNRRLINYAIDDDMDGQGAPLAIYTKSGGVPISAEWRILNTWSPVLPPRYTNDQFGRATILPAPGPITIEGRKKGYWPDTTTVIIQPGDIPTRADLDLVQKPSYAMNFMVHDASNNPIPCKIILKCDFPEEIDAPSGNSAQQMPLDAYYYSVVPLSGDFVAHWGQFYLNHDTTLNLTLATGAVRWAESFTTGMTNWIKGGSDSAWSTFADTTGAGFGQSLYTGAQTVQACAWVYNNSRDAWAAYANGIDLTGCNAAHLEFFRTGRLEVPADSVFVEVSTNGGTAWDVAAGYCDMELPWTKTWVNLSPWTGNNIRLRFRINTDSTVQDLGLLIDNLKILSGTDLSLPPIQPRPVYEYKITGAYPNPFNPTTTITYDVALAGKVNLLIFNILGQEVRRFNLNPTNAGHHSLRWDGMNSGGAPVPSGLYFAQLDAPNTTSIYKLLLLK